ncbi:MAG: PAS domain S-box protein [Verrucomicrobiaceae bacterium]|nr:MAG: PAS domain S-box protein [Verrucomicrobiaceae bacterium]
MRDFRGMEESSGRPVRRRISRAVRTDAELRVTEDRFRDFVTATSEMVYQLNGDWSVLLHVKGKRLIPDTNEPRGDWLEAYIPEDERPRLVAAYQEAIAGKKVFALEHRVIRKDGTEGWVSSRALPILDGEGNISSWLGSAADITETKTYARRQKYLLYLSDELRNLADPVAIRTVAMRVLGEHLHATRALYFEAEPNGEWLMTIGGYTHGVPTMKERVRMDDFGEHIRRSFREGKTLVVEDVSRDKRVSAEELKAYEGIEVRAHIAIPLTKAGRIVAVLGIHQERPHHWTAEDVELSEATAERTWAALEQARAETSLRKSEEKYRTLFNSMDEGFCIIRMVYDDDGNAIDWRFLETNPGFHKHTGMPGCVGRTMREIVPDIERKWVDIYHRVAVTGESLRFEESSAPLHRTFDLYAFRVGEPQERKVAVLFTNITARRRAEVALAESEKNYQFLFDSIDEGFCTIEMLFDGSGKACDYRFLQVNAAFERQTGLADVVGRRVREFVPEHEDEWFFTFGEVAQTGDSVRFENEASKLGRYFDVYAFRIGEPEDRRVGVLFRDVAERKRHELGQELLVKVVDSLADLENVGETLQKIAEKVGGHFSVEHCMLVELSKDPEGELVFHVWDGEGRMPLAPNSKLEDFLATEQVRACHAGETTVVEDTRADARVSAEHYEKVGIRSFIATPLMRDDRCRFLLVVTDHKVRHWSSDESELLQELAERIWNRLERARAEEALRAAEEDVRGSEERLRIALESAGMAAWDWVVDGDTVMWNEGHYRILGLEPGSGRESCAFFLEFVYPEDREEVSAGLYKALEDGTRFEAEFRIVRHDTGEVRWMSGFGRPLEVRDGRTARLTGVMYDVTERKLMTDTLRKAHGKLETRVQERTRELSNALDRLTEESAGRERLEEERHDLLERLVVSQEEERTRISRELHDNLSQHMVAVKMGLGAVEKEIRTMGRGNDVNLAAGLAELSRRVDGLIDAAHRQAWELRPSELDHLGLEVALRHYAQVWGQQCGMRVEWDSAGWDEGLRLSAQAEIHLYRVVQEALNNVVRHAEAGKVTLTLESGDEVVLTVEDDGKGFTNPEGSGRLGLIGMRERMTLLGGELEVDSVRGRGSRITLRLPMAGYADPRVRAPGDGLRE